MFSPYNDWRACASAVGKPLEEVSRNWKTSGTRRLWMGGELIGINVETNPLQSSHVESIDY
jgi:hypothetical protein